MMESPLSPSRQAFDTYYREFASLLLQLEGSPDDHPDSSCNNNINDDDNRKKKADDATKKQSLHHQCSDLLRLMSLEARSTDCPDTKFERLERVKIYKFQLEAVRHEHDTEFLMGDQASSMLQLEQERQHIKDRLGRNEMRAAQQNELLERARRSVEETEGVATAILQETKRNRETIEATHKNVTVLSSMTDQASNLVQKLSRPWWLRR